MIKARGMRLSALWCGLLAAVVCLVPTGRALAQRGPGAAAAMMGPKITQSSLRKYGDMLGLDQGQREVVKILHGSYMDTMRDLDQAYQEVMSGMWSMEQDGQPSIEEMQANARKFMDASKQYQSDLEEIEKGFFEDVKMVLEEDQLGSWPRIERMRRREKANEEGIGDLISWTGLDLVDVAGQIEMPPEADAEVDSLLLQYEVEIDRVLRGAEQLQKEMVEDVSDPMDFDMEKMQEAMEKVIGLMKEIRSLNRGYARRVETAMPEAKRDEFQKAVRERVYPKVYTRSQTSTAIETARAFEDLDESQKGSLASLAEQYSREAADLNQRWASAIDTRDDDLSTESMMSGSFMMDDGTPVGEARKARRALDKMYREKLDAVLSEAQRSRLPAFVEDRSPWEQFQIDMENMEFDTEGVEVIEDDQ